MHETLTDRERAALIALKTSRKYASLCPETTERVFLDALSRHRSAKDAEKAARAKLHQIAGAFMTDGAERAARKCLDDFVAGDAGALERALKLHASTRERQSAAVFERAIEVVGRPTLTLDLACGLNPLALGRMGLTALGYDIHGGAVALVNEFARAAGYDVSAHLRDVLVPYDYPEADLALFMKLLPVLEREASGAAEKLLAAVPARFKLITFPKRSLSGRDVGMEAHYGAWMDAHLPAHLRVIDQFLTADELCYLTEDNHG